MKISEKKLKEIIRECIDEMFKKDLNEAKAKFNIKKDE